MMSFFRIPFFFFFSCLLLCSGLPLSVAHAEVIHNPTPPVKKTTKKKAKQKKRLRFKRSKQKKLQKKQGNIVLNLYITFGILILLPTLILAGILIVALGFPQLLAYILGASLIGLVNIGMILAGIFAGSTNSYSTQTLFFATWVLAGLNLAAVITFSLLYALLFPTFPLMLFLIIGVVIATLVFLVWGILIACQRKKFNQSSRLKEDEKGRS